MAPASARSACPAAHGARSRRGGCLAYIAVLAAGLGVVSALAQLRPLPAGAFAVGAAVRAPAHRTSPALCAEPEEAPASLVKITEESKITTVSILGGLVGLLVGGFWVGAASFVASSYFARRDDDVADALKGIASGGLEALNFGSNINEKYQVTDKVGDAVSGAVESAKKNADTREAISSLEGVVGNVTGAVESVDRDIGIRDTLGSLVTSASEAANKGVEKVVELNDEYKVTDQLSQKIQEVSKSK
eukprot:CAMPEP_0179086266 /NCGR_PEP_ID=MMETSP0796-20121207/39120_1 /TAXON_ID=73915 /ORGANISM="Pyrodinium bahamense, Strain pbaha01" /LENGTH=246 /DNA_ID=CAMNT_0020783729 /DNA_START=66 /DNA_END=806 /DNA_ORIENTATION=-